MMNFLVEAVNSFVLFASLLVAPSEIKLRDLDNPALDLILAPAIYRYDKPVTVFTNTHKPRLAFRYTASTRAMILGPADIPENPRYIQGALLIPPNKHLVPEYGWSVKKTGTITTSGKCNDVNYGIWIYDPTNSDFRDESLSYLFKVWDILR